MVKRFTLFIFLFLSVTILWAQENWEQVSSLPEEFHTHHSFAFALDGKGYITTGSTDFGLTNDFYQYDSNTDEWTKLDDFPGGSRSFAIGDTYNGKAYFGFGVGTFVRYNDLWVFDPATMEWEELASCPCDRRTHPAFVAHQGKVYVGLGGGSSQNLKDWWQYDIATDTWEEKAEFPSSRRHHPYQFALGDYVYVGFGHGASIYNEWYRYDPSTDTWTEVAELPAEGRVAGTQFSHGGKGYALSGDGSDHYVMDDGEFWEYDPENDAWTQLPSHPGLSRWAPSSFVLNNQVYLINGQTAPNGGGYEYISTIYRYTLDEPLSSTTLENNIAVDVFPNPFEASLQLNVDFSTLEGDDFETKLYTINGQVVYQAKGIVNEIHVPKLTSGMYWVEIISKEQQFRTLVIKK